MALLSSPKITLQQRLSPHNDECRLCDQMRKVTIIAGKNHNTYYKLKVIRKSVIKWRCIYLHISLQLIGEIGLFHNLLTFI